MDNQFFDEASFENEIRELDSLRDSVNEFITAAKAVKFPNYTLKLADIKAAIEQNNVAPLHEIYKTKLAEILPDGVKAELPDSVIDLGSYFPFINAHLSHYLETTLKGAIIPESTSEALKESHTQEVPESEKELYALCLQITSAINQIGAKYTRIGKIKGGAFANALLDNLCTVRNIGSLDYWDYKPNQDWIRKHIQQLESEGIELV